MSLIQKLLELISPVLRQMVEEFARKFRDTALSTENPVDDIAAYLLFLFIGIPWNSK